jgi:NTE family protein
MVNEIRPSCKIGLALSGGGARGLAHIGILKVLEQTHIPIDFIAGTSMGAIIGACIAKGMTAAEIEGVTTKFSSVRQMIRMVDMAGGRRGLLAGNRVREFLSELIGAGIEFRELKIPLAVCSVNLEDGSETVFTQGNVLNAVMASIAVPGIFTPQPVDDGQYVDGGVKNNLPVDHVRRLGAEFVIAVDVMHHDFSKLGTSGRAELFSVTPPTSFQEIYRFVAMMISEQTRLRLLLDTPDILITPELSNDLLSFGGFSRASEAIQAGEMAAAQALPELLSKLDLPG